MITITCCCIAFVGLMAIAIKKISLRKRKSVQPINIPSISARLMENIQGIHSSRSEEQQNTFELEAVQSHARIINVAPINLEEQMLESLDNIDMSLQPMNLNEFVHNEFNSIVVENPGSEETPEAPNQIQMLRLNTQKFNPSLISFPVLTFLYVIFLILFPIYVWYIPSANDFENHIPKTHVISCIVTIVLPTV